MLNGQTMPPDLSGDWLFVMTAAVGSDGPFTLYVTVRGDVVAAYGPCPVAAYSAFGTSSPAGRDECVKLLWYSSDAAIQIAEDGAMRPLAYTYKFAMRPGITAFAAPETAALASAAAGWPDPVVMYGQNRTQALDAAARR